MRRVAGVDVGGTFTDLLLYEAGPRGQPVRLAKIPTTAANQADGVLAAIAQAGVSPARSRPHHPRHHHHHQRRARAQARQASASSPRAGFRDMLELGRRTRPKPYGMTGTLRAADPARPAARGRRAHGRARARWCTPLDEAARARPRSRALLRHGLRERWSSISCTPTPTRRTSCAPARSRARSGPTPTSRSATRCCRSSASTSAAPRPSVNAAVQPILDRYVRRLQGELERAAAIARDLLVMNGNGGTVSARARGARGGQDRDVGPGLGRDGGGGDAGAVGHRQRHHLRHGRHLDRRGADPRRRAAGLGRARASTTACRSTCRWWTCARVGAGGGSIAAIDAAGMLQVGPRVRGRRARARSATAAAAREPTITDANLVLGRLIPARLLAVSTAA